MLKAQEIKDIAKDAANGIIADIKYTHGTVLSLGDYGIIRNTIVSVIEKVIQLNTKGEVV